MHPLAPSYLGRAWVSPTLMGCLVLGTMVYRTTDRMLVSHQFRHPGCRDQIYLQLSTLRAWCGLGRKWLLLADISNFPCGAIQVIVILTEMTVAIQSCPPSMIYTLKLGIWATTTVVRFMHYSFRTHFKEAGWSTAIRCKILSHADIVGNHAPNILVNTTHPAGVPNYVCAKPCYNIFHTPSHAPGMWLHGAESNQCLHSGHWCLQFIGQYVHLKPPQRALHPVYHNTPAPCSRRLATILWKPQNDAVDVG